jgi:hypothetical protein
MPRTAQTHAFGPRTDRATLGRLGTPIGSPGQCKAVYPLLDHTGMLFKEYRPSQIKDADEIRLARLVALPDRLAAADRDLLLRGTCWPRTQVIEGGRTVGVVIPSAPRRYYEALSDPEGGREVVPLLLTHLAMPNSAFPPVGLRVPSLETRLAVCTDLIAIADLFERHGLVYGDWGYKNIFWSQRDSSVYVIDVDACSFGPQPWVESFGFADPFTPANQPVDTYTDRFRCAIAVAACLFGDKDPQSAVSGLMALRGTDDRVEHLKTVVRQMATARDRTQRLPISHLQNALSGAGTATTNTGPATPNDTTPEEAPDEMGIVGWEEVEPLPPLGPLIHKSAPRPTPTGSPSTRPRPTRPTSEWSPAPHVRRSVVRRRRHRTIIAAVTATVVALAVAIPLLIFVL